ncbi:hypothetical protein SISSUDRAFT_1041157 [Sistotremastrum suecicum HHB10207 ss-3]|uniref:Trafficking protein particle complex II-specific subunit 65 IgD3 domain-containing protein n=1 Tax=Sistotremastrum suecicum HHB10207 ss-3 TaxID=1314776 RepID=A0A166HCA5_9AGAM|nr:hypothetical protein SISSUDRAFT_1041157 [Sistotremastrum suecicum HHB10207 ss-3]
MSFEQLFTVSSLDILIPERLESPPDLLSDDQSVWINSVVGQGSRTQAFYDEYLEFYLFVNILHPETSHVTTASLARPPTSLLLYLSHLQISLDASYIPLESGESTPPSSSYTSSLRLGPTPTTTKSSLPASLAHPTSFPPNTPHPTPSSTDKDRRYARTDGAIIQSYIWGERRKDDAQLGDVFSLVWNKATSSWCAIYRMGISVSYPQVPMDEPLLCLTASTTLRDKPLLITPARMPLKQLMKEYQVDTEIYDNNRTAPVRASRDSISLEEDVMHGLEEVNLLNIIASGPILENHQDSTPLSLPSSRLSPNVRKDAYALLTSTPDSPDSADITPTSSRPIQTLRKSFRKTLRAVSGFHLRMLTAFVPYVVLPGNMDEEEEYREAGSEERTVVLCVEVENQGQSEAGFSVESILVKVGGDGTRTRLIGWGDNGFSEPEQIYPLHIRPGEQFNLLYAVSFLRSPDAFSFPNSTRASGTAFHPNIDFQRPVSIVIQGRPYTAKDLVGRGERRYTTETFTSRWNCILDLTTAQKVKTRPVSLTSNQDVLPVPASPFPISSPKHWTKLAQMQDAQSQTQATIVGGRHAFSQTGARSNKPLPPILPSTFSRDPVKRSSTPVGSSSGRLPATSTTPAYPAYSGTPLPPTPPSVHPTGRDIQVNGSAVSARRQGFNESSPTIDSHHSPHGPMPSNGQSIIVSVQLLQSSSGPETSNLIYPGDVFSLEIFVFNESSRTRRFEIGHLDRRSRHKDKSAKAGTLAEKDLGPGITPMENHVRIGPLRPQTCQSVRMKFLALRPGLHAIDTLSLTDVQLGSVLNLRSVMDISVHDYREI